MVVVIAGLMTVPDATGHNPAITLRMELFPDPFSPVMTVCIPLQKAMHVQ
jgi:hypothetical protein